MGEPAAFDRLMADADPAMIVLTTAAAGERAGCLVGFHSQISIEPEHYGVWISTANHTCRVARGAERFAVHFLTETAPGVAEHFGTLTGDDVDKFAGIEWEPGPDGVPLLVACPNRLLLERVAIHELGGDHLCLVGRVVSAHAPEPFAPLRLSRCEHLHPGHASG